MIRKQIDFFLLVNGLIHLSEKYLIETLRNECKKYVYTWLHDLELTIFDEKKELIPRHILYKDGTRKHISTEIGKMSSKKKKRKIAPTIQFQFLEHLCHSSR